MHFFWNVANTVVSPSLHVGFNFTSKMANERAELIPFPSSRDFEDRAFRFNRMYGPTPTRDLLLGLPCREKKPTVLLLGCEDVWSFFYTIWKHFSSYSVRVSGRAFDGAHFLFNDCTRGFLAKNVLLLHLLLRSPFEEVAMKEWLCAVWAVSFCHELYPEHERVFKDALTDLLAVSGSAEAWSGENNLLRNAVQFSHLGVLEEIRALWKEWLDKTNPIQRMNDARMFYLEMWHESYYGNRAEISRVLSRVIAGFPLGWDEAIIGAMEQELKLYIESGSVYAETVLGLSCDPGMATTSNPTLYDSTDRSFFLYYCTRMPFASFFHGVEFSAKHGITKSTLSPAIQVEQSAFDTNHFLANSVQQLAVWVRAVKEVLQPVLDQPKPCYTIVLDNALPIVFCQWVHQGLSWPGHDKSQVSEVFDIIHCHRFTDHFSLPALVLSSLQLLKKQGTLFCTTFLYISAGHTVETCLEDIFGFSPDMLPIICGALCVGHEGQYADSSPLLPCFTVESLPGLVHKELFYAKLLAWKKMPCTLIKISSLEVQPYLANALFSMIRTVVTSYFQSNQRYWKSSLCTETAMQVLLAFVGQLDKSVQVSWCFWDSLCSLVRKSKALQPFLVHLQTQALLHQIHLHLTLTEVNCPICRSHPLSDTVLQYSLTLVSSASAFLVVVHQEEDSDTIGLIPKTGCIGLPTENVHIIDSTSCRFTKQSTTKKLNFFLPKSLEDEDYHCTVYSVHISGDTREAQHHLETHFSSKLESVGSHSSYTYAFEINRSIFCHPSSELGHIAEFQADSSQCSCTLSVSSTVADTAIEGEVELEKITDFALEYRCGRHELKVSIPFPVNYDTVKLRSIKEERAVAFKVFRRLDCFTDRNELFISVPDNGMCFPVIHFNREEYKVFSNAQYTEDDAELATSCAPFEWPVYLQVKVVLAVLLNVHACEPFVQIKVKEEGGLVPMVTGLYYCANILMDLEKRSLALDVYFHFLNQRSEQVLLKWFDTIESEGLNKVRSVYVSSSEAWKHLKRYFCHSASHTMASPRKTVPILCKYGLDKHFSRALVYPYYTDPDAHVMENLQLMGCRATPEERGKVTVASGVGNMPEYMVLDELIPPPSPLTDVPHCTVCLSRSTCLKACPGCSKTMYCSDKCRKFHWESGHRVLCPAKPKCEQDVDTCEKCNISTDLCRCQPIAGSIKDFKVRKI